MKKFTLSDIGIYVCATLLLSGIFAVYQFVGAHPGGTATDGCHYCRSDCDKWNVPWDERHCHIDEEEESGVSTTETVQVVDVTDGDTIKILLDGVTEKVRILGIDTPETVHPTKPVECFGKEASEKMRSLVSGELITLERKPSEDRDRYDRLLRYVRLNGEDIGAMMIREGFAYSYRKYPHPRLDEYNALEQEAREGLRGLWGSGCEEESEVLRSAAEDSVFTDVSISHPYSSAIRWAKDGGVLNGYPDGTFKPDKTVNRVEFLKIVLEASDADVGSATEPVDFSDVNDDAWYMSYVRFAKAQGIVKGYEDGTFKPDRAVNFAEALKMAYIALEISTEATPGEWYTRYLMHAKDNDILFTDNVDMEVDMSRKDVVWVVWKLALL